MCLYRPTLVRHYSNSNFTNCTVNSLSKTCVVIVYVLIEGNVVNELLAYVNELRSFSVI